MILNMIILFILDSKIANVAFWQIYEAQNGFQKCDNFQNAL